MDTALTSLEQASYKPPIVGISSTIFTPTLWYLSVAAALLGKATALRTSCFAIHALGMRYTKTTPGFPRFLGTILTKLSTQAVQSPILYYKNTASQVSCGAQTADSIPAVRKRASAIKLQLLKHASRKAATHQMAQHLKA